MINEEEIREWWDRKIDNHIKNYARRNKLSLAQAKEKNFTETHKTSLRAFHKHFKNYCKVVHETSTTSTIDAHAPKWWKN